MRASSGALFALSPEAQMQQLGIGLGAAATLVLVNTNTGEIPTVSNVSAQLTSDSVRFSWPDPGLRADDQYQIATRDGQSSIQSVPSFTVDAENGDRVCITVTVNRDGKTGPASSEKCVDFVSG